jgi:hypothetical protein
MTVVPLLSTVATSNPLHQVFPFERETSLSPNSILYSRSGSLTLCDCHIHCIASLRRVQGHCSIGPLCRERKVSVVKLLPVAHSSTSSASIPSLQPITYKRRVCITSIYQAFTAD